VGATTPVPDDPGSHASPVDELKLIGIAEDTPGAADPGRTAIVSFGGRVLMVRAGDTIGARYRVARIGADAIELVEVAGESDAIRVTF
jgi:Tfp pilus assembly protein PilP